MRVRHGPSPLLLFLIPSLAASLALASPAAHDKEPSAAVALPAAAATASAAASVKAKYEVGTKDAPVDGKDGRPHEGPFVEVDNLRKADAAGDAKKKGELPTLKDQPVDPTVIVIDGKKIPDSNDGVMDDKNRPEPKKGTTGTEGGVSEKDKARKAKEGQTGERVENRPETPKEAPPLPHSEQEKMTGDKKDKSKGNPPEDMAGFGKPSNLPGKTHDKAPPVPDSANKDHLDVAKGESAKPPSQETAAKKFDEDVADGIIQPFHSFILSLTMILFSEVGDKTFLVAALMAMKHDRLVVFSAAFSALITMTVLSAVLGHAVPTLIPKRVTSFLAAGLFLVFGARMLREGLAMRGDEGVSAEMQEVEMELAEKEHQARERGRRGSALDPYSLEMGMGSERKSRSKSRFPTPPRSPPASPGRSRGAGGSGAGGIVGSVGSFLGGFGNLMSLLLSPAWVQTFVMTFLGEWGDRSQIATIAMAAGQDYWWVTLGAVLGHACCTGVAVIGGRAIAGRVSLKVVTVGGAVAFLLFGFIYFVEAFCA